MKKKLCTPFFIEVYLRTYRRSVVVFFGTTAEGILKMGKKRGISVRLFTDSWVAALKELSTEKTTSGFTMQFGDNNTDVLISMRERPKKASEYGRLYHEVYHAVDEIAWAVDETNKLTTKDGTSEARAYLFEHIVNELNSKLWK